MSSTPNIFSPMLCSTDLLRLFCLCLALVVYVSFSLQLNKIPKGGATVFPNIGAAVWPEKVCIHLYSHNSVWALHVRRYLRLSILQSGIFFRIRTSVRVCRNWCAESLTQHFPDCIIKRLSACTCMPYKED